MTTARIGSGSNRTFHQLENKNIPHQYSIQVFINLREICHQEACSRPCARRSGHFPLAAARWQTSSALPPRAGCSPHSSAAGEGIPEPIVHARGRGEEERLSDTSPRGVGGVLGGDGPLAWPPPSNLRDPQHQYLFPWNNPEFPLFPSLSATKKISSGAKGLKLAIIVPKGNDGRSQTPPPMPWRRPATSGMILPPLPPAPAPPQMFFRQLSPRSARTPAWRRARANS